MNRLASRRSLVALLATGLVARSALADDLPQPQERVILTVSGRIGLCNDGDLAQFDRPMLEAVGMQGFATGTPWYSGTTRFDGILMRRLLQSVRASGDRVTATALNDYTTEIPMADFERFDVLLALKRDGDYMPVRDKGPLFIVYPFDSDKRLQGQPYYGRSAWQIRHIVIG